MYYLTDEEESRLQAGLQAAFTIPFIDDVEDFVWEAIFAYAKNIPLPDPLFNTRYKTLFDVVDPISPERIGWSAKTLMWAVAPNIEFELVVQRADIFSKAYQLGFEPLTLASPTHLLGAALLQHWNQKVLEDAIRQQVREKRVAILLKSRNYRRFACYETDLRLYTSDEFVAFRWYSNQKQLFERFRLPPEVKIFELEPKRLPLPEVVQILPDRLGNS